MPARPAGDEDDDKTVHYTTGPALVTRAYIEGGFLDSVRLLYGTMLGPSDPAGWGAFGPYGVHLHAGTWKATKELNHTRLLARALAHAQAGRHEQAAGVLKRVALHSSGKLEPAAIDEVWKEYFLSFRRAGRPAKAHLDIAHDRLAARQLEPAMHDLADAEAAATAMGQLDLRAEVHVLRSLVIARRALEADRNLDADRNLEADPRDGASGASKGLSKAAARTAGGGDGGGGADADATAAAAAELQSALRLQPNAPMPRLVWAMHRLRASATHAAEAVPQLAHAIVLERQARSRGILKPTHETVSAPDETVSAPDETASAPDETASAPDETVSAPDETASAPDETASAPDETASAPLSLPFVLYVWHTSPVLRASMEGSPPIATLLGRMRSPADLTSHTPADLETVDVMRAKLDAARDHSHPASPRPPATQPSASARSAGRARAAAHPEWLAGGPGRTAAVLPIDAAEAARLAHKRRTPFTSGTAWLRVNEFGVPSIEFSR